LQVAQANAKAKTCKRACLPKRQADRKDAAKMKENRTRKINNETLINRNMSGTQCPAIIPG
jgi:hypothetical protein